MSTFIRH